MCEVLSGPAPEVAPLLLGAVLVSTVDDQTVRCRITEVEAYLGVGEDPASHAHRGRTRRNATMFGPPGHLYVYFTYGMHYCCNVVTSPEGTASGVLIRAGEIIEGAAVAQPRRGTSVRPRDLARGPARLAQALGLNGTHDGVDLCDPVSVVRLELAAPVSDYGTSPRTGVSGPGAVTPWRYFLQGDSCVSPYRPAALRTRRA